MPPERDASRYCTTCAMWCVVGHADLDEQGNLHPALAIDYTTYYGLRTVLSTWVAGPHEDGRPMLLGTMVMSPLLDICAKT